MERCLDACGSGSQVRVFVTNRAEETPTPLRLLVQAGCLGLSNPHHSLFHLPLLQHADPSLQRGIVHDGAQGPDPVLERARSRGVFVLACHVGDEAQHRAKGKNGFSTRHSLRQELLEVLLSIQSEHGIIQNQPTLHPVPLR